MSEEQNFAHQEKLFSPDLARPVTVIGAGSVGSVVVMELAKVGATDITVWDADVVESHNAPMSAYGYKDIARLKVDALRDRVLEDTGVLIKTKPRMYEGESLKNTVVACVDTMAARQCIFDRVRNNPFVDVLVDTRIAETYFEVYAVSPCDKVEEAAYTDSLHADAEAVLRTCGRHGIIFVTNIVASGAVLAVTNVWQRKPKEWLWSFQVHSLHQVMPGRK